MTSFKSFFAFAAFVVFICITSCSTPQTARSKGAVATYSSKKSSATVADCVVASWESAWGVTQPVAVRPTAEGKTIQISANGNTMVLLDISDAPAGGSVSLYYKGYVFFEGDWDEGVKNCQ